MKFKLLTEQNGYKDYDVLNHPAGVRRACVPNRIPKGDVFNVYIGKGTKMGCEWLGNVEKSLKAFSAA